MVLILLSCIKAINIDYYWNFYIHLLKNLSQIYEKHSWWKLTCWEVFQYFSHVKKIQYFKSKLKNVHNIAHYVFFSKLQSFYMPVRTCKYECCVTCKIFAKIERYFLGILRDWGKFWRKIILRNIKLRDVLRRIEGYFHEGSI